VDRLLTSGQQASVPEGKEVIRQLVERSAGRIGILPGCGITPENAVEMVRYTGVKEFHATAFSPQKSAMNYRNERVYMGIPGLPEYERQVTSADEVKRFLERFS
jgi:copper homeostasis protein